jgi:AAA15 family ATPase/GTPase
MRIYQINVDNFKSLLNFELKLSKFSCLIGLNGSGKSTVLQLFDFLAQQFNGDISGWLVQKHWSAIELNSRLSNKSNIDFTIRLTHEGVDIEWHASFNRKLLRCTKERITWNNNLLLNVKDGRYSVYGLANQHIEQNLFNSDISFSYQGSILSQLKEEQLPNELYLVKNFFRQIYALDMLSPELLRQRTRESRGTFGLGGEKFSAFMHDRGVEKRQKLTDKLKKVYPQLEFIDSKSLRSGWKQMNISEVFGGKSISTEARHINDGLLRMMAVFAQLAYSGGFMLLDEIENGINPELIEFLLDSLVESSLQVLVTTHSPVILNYLDDSIAKEGVIYLYKTDLGSTKSVRFFDIPSMMKKLEIMGPGEAYEDTLLNELSSEILAMNQVIS